MNADLIGAGLAFVIVASFIGGSMWMASCQLDRDKRKDIQMKYALSTRCQTTQTLRIAIQAVMQGEDLIALDEATSKSQSLFGGRGE